MDYMKRIIERIETGKPIVINFDIDQFSKRGAKARAIGLTRFRGQWWIELEFKKWKGTSETISLDDYMKNTNDVL